VKDLTHGSIYRHVLSMAAPIAAGMLLQTLSLIVDLYFVAELGDAALAGVGAAGTAMFAVFALTQMLGVGTVALMSHAVGRKDRGDANHIFNQSVALSALCAAVTLAGGFGLARTYMQWIGADAPTMAAGVTYLYWFTPGLALQFALVAMSSALRGTGIVRPSMIVQAVTVLLNIILAPVLIAGWGTGHPLGVAGAGLASTVAIAAGVVLMAIYFLRLEKYVEFDLSQWRPQFGTWRRILNIGLPAGGEFALMAIFSGVVYGSSATPAPPRRRPSASARGSCRRSSCRRWRCLRRRADRGPEFRRQAARTCARYLSRCRVHELRDRRC
jgi:putative MATE family efflux protein